MTAAGLFFFLIVDLVFLILFFTTEILLDSHFWLLAKAFWAFIKKLIINLLYNKIIIIFALANLGKAFYSHWIPLHGIACIVDAHLLSYPTSELQIADWV